MRGMTEEEHEKSQVKIASVAKIQCEHTPDALPMNNLPITYTKITFKV
jgi:hypothetical protein